MTEEASLHIVSGGLIDLGGGRQNRKLMSESELHVPSTLIFTIRST